MGTCERHWTPQQNDLGGDKLDIFATALGHPSNQEGGFSNSLSGGKVTYRFADVRIQETCEGIADC